MRVELPVNVSHIRQLDVHRDLLQVADLIELCFANTLDADGREYLRQIRRAAIDSAYLRWVPGADERVSMPLYGYVWEQDQRVVGNLSLIPIYKGGRWLYLIANVAVLPEFRRCGIAHALTLRALRHIRDHRVGSAWLQVRDDNPSAQRLYEATGFIERSRRTTWVNQFNPPAPQLNGVNVTGRRAGDWEQQLAWLKQTYPTEATWNMTFDAQRFSYGFWRQVWQWFNGEPHEHWVARQTNPDKLMGFASWEPSHTLSDQVWLAADPETEVSAIRALLPQVNKFLLPRRRPININYPAGHAGQAFIDCGYHILNTLIWMERPLLP